MSFRGLLEKLAADSKMRPFPGDGLRDLEGPISRSMHGNVFTVKRSGLTRDGALYRHDEMVEFVARFSWACHTERIFMNVTDELQKQYEQAADLWKGYEERLNKFRSAVRNDVASIEASARKTTEAVHKMNRAYAEVLTQLNSDEMQTAIANAERLAAALNQLAAMQAHKLVFSVAEQEKK